MKGRDLISLLGGTAIRLLLAARAQPAGRVARIGCLSLALFIAGVATQVEAQEQRKLPRIGVLMTGSEASSRIQLDGLRKGLADAGIAEGSGAVLDIKYADGKVDQLAPLAADLVKSRPDVLFTGGDQGASAVKRAAAGQMPIVAVTCDALAAGLVSNLARPGENLTGVTCINADLAAKRVEIMKDLTPSLSRLGIALNLSDKRMVSELRESGARRSHRIGRHQYARPRQARRHRKRARDGRGETTRRRHLRVRRHDVLPSRPGGPGGNPATAADRIQLPPIRRRRRAVFIWPEPGRYVSPVSAAYPQSRQRRSAGTNTNGATHALRARDQPQDGGGDRHLGAGRSAHPRQRCCRVTSCRPSRTGTDQVPDNGQPQDREGARPRRAAIRTRPRRRGDRVAPGSPWASSPGDASSPSRLQRSLSPTAATDERTARERATRDGAPPAPQQSPG